MRYVSLEELVTEEISQVIFTIPARRFTLGGPEFLGLAGGIRIGRVRRAARPWLSGVYPPLIYSRQLIKGGGYMIYRILYSASNIIVRND